MKISIFCMLLSICVLFGNTHEIYGQEKSMELVNADDNVNYTSNKNDVKKGYSINLKKPIICNHKPQNAAYIYVNLNGMTNTKTKLVNNIKMVKNGNRSFHYTVRTDTTTVKGTGKESVSANQLFVTIEGSEFKLAYPYVCVNDGHAGYTYIKCFFSYCEKTARWFFLGTTHHWLGCTRGDIGIAEEYLVDYSHTVYTWEKNIGTIKYHSNGGNSQENYLLSSGIVHKKADNLPVTKKFDYETAEIDLINVGTLLKRPGYHVNANSAWLINGDPKQSFPQTATTDLDKLKIEIEKTDASITLYANWQPNVYQVKYNGNGGNGNMDNSSHTYDLSTSLSKNKFSRTYYKFAGWNTMPDGSGMGFGEQEAVTNLSQKNNETINLYAVWEEQKFHIAYHGNGQTTGVSLLDFDIFQGIQNYKLHNNIFEKECVVLKDKYECKENYSFQGWSFNKNAKFNDKDNFLENSMIASHLLYNQGAAFNAVTTKTPGENEPYEVITEGTYIDANNSERYRQIKNNEKEEFLNLYAVWDAYPTIIVIEKDQKDNENLPEINENLPVFIEGEKVNKKDLTDHLYVHDTEDGDLKDKLRIIKIRYGQGERKKGYTLKWEEDVPNDFIFDTYYMELNEDEIVEHFVTYAVTDSCGNTTIIELPVQVKYNHYPEIRAEEVLYYFKEDANQGMITESELLPRAEAFDKEDQDEIKDKLKLHQFDPEEYKMQNTAKKEYDITYVVTDSLNKTSYKTIKIKIVDSDAVISQLPKSYVRFISYQHLNSLEETSIWRDEENINYLKGILKNENAFDVWNFSKQSILKIKEWIVGNEGESWKSGKDANVEFLKLFNDCNS